jgi:hypothetical protein
VISFQKQRSAPRRRVRKFATIAFHQPFSSVRSVLRDLSLAGAHLFLEGTINGPNSSGLTIDLDDLEANCQVVWQQDKELGIRFACPPRLVTPKRTQVVSPPSAHSPAQVSGLADWLLPGSHAARRAGLGVILGSGGLVRSIAQGRLADYDMAQG